MKIFARTIWIHKKSYGTKYSNIGLRIFSIRILGPL